MIFFNEVTHEQKREKSNPKENKIHGRISYNDVRSDSYFYHSDDKSIFDYGERA